MNSREAQKILADGQSNGTPNALFHGLEIISWYCSDPVYLAIQGYVYAGVRQFGEIVSKMTEEEIEKLSGLGWFYDRTYDCLRFEIRQRV